MPVTFLIQVDENERFMHDFTFYLDLAIQKTNWFYNEEIYKTIYSKDIKDDSYKNCIPVGSVEYVTEFYKKHFNIEKINPINIPASLMKYKYLKRNIMSATKENINKLPEGEYFIKDISKIKGLVDIVNKKYIPVNDNILISKIIDIKSEWRCFVYNNKIIGLKNYSGDFISVPNIELIQEMMDEFKEAPSAYTIDVGIEENTNDTFLIEIHDFFSCGLYGFDDSKNLPRMYISTHKHILEKYLR